MKITTSRVIDAVLAKQRVKEGFNHELNWDYIREREKDGGVLDPEALAQSQIKLKVEWWGVISVIDAIQDLWKGHPSRVIHSLEGKQSCKYDGHSVRVLASAGRTLLTIEFADGNWFTFIADEAEKSDFVFQGCFIGGEEGDITLDDVLSFVRRFTAIVTPEVFLYDSALRIG
jgi:hypothetical protein